jgi:hypothetical protein
LLFEHLRELESQREEVERRDLRDVVTDVVTDACSGSFGEQQIHQTHSAIHPVIHPPDLRALPKEERAVQGRFREGSGKVQGRFREGDLRALPKEEGGALCASQRVRVQDHVPMRRVPAVISKPRRDHKSHTRSRGARVGGPEDAALLLRQQLHQVGALRTYQPDVHHLRPLVRHDGGGAAALVGSGLVGSFGRLLEKVPAVISKPRRDHKSTAISTYPDLSLKGGGVGERDGSHHRLRALEPGKVQGRYREGTGKVQGRYREISPHHRLRALEPGTQKAPAVVVRPRRAPRPTSPTSPNDSSHLADLAERLIPPR